MWCLLYKISSQKKEGLSRTAKENNIDYSLWERGSNDRLIIIPITKAQEKREKERERERESERKSESKRKRKKENEALMML